MTFGDCVRRVIIGDISSGHNITPQQQQQQWIMSTAGDISRAGPGYCVTLSGSSVSDQKVFPSLVMTAMDSWRVLRRILKQIGMEYIIARNGASASASPSLCWGGSYPWPTLGWSLKDNQSDAWVWSRHNYQCRVTGQHYAGSYLNLHPGRTIELSYFDNLDNFHSECNWRGL